MTVSLNFFTPIWFPEQKTFEQNIQERIDDYFYLGGKSAFVIPREISGNSYEVMIKDLGQNRVKQVILGAIKIISYMTVIIPLIMLIAKASFRSAHKFHIVSKDESMFSQDYFRIIKKATYYDHYLASFKNAIDDNTWNNIQGLSFLIAEFQGIKGESLDLLDKIKSVPMECQEKKELKEFTSKLIDEITAFLNALQNKVQDKTSLRGFKNVGNTCYMNSALQPLLAVKNFRRLIPDSVASEPECSYEERKKILSSFKDFFKSWENKETIAELGSKVGDLRRQIFKAGLLEGGFLDKSQEGGFQDTGQFFELILHVLGKGFQLEMTKTPIRNDGTSIEISKKIEETPQGVFYLQLHGESLQEIVNEYKAALDQEFTPGNEWQVEDPNSQSEILVSRCKEMQKIMGLAPEILVVRVNNHVVKPEQDQVVDFASLLKEPSRNCNYKLVGFSQNHNQFHWTSVVWDGSNWHYCNDDRTEQVSTESDSFKHPANYMIFQKTK